MGLMTFVCTTAPGVVDHKFPKTMLSDLEWRDKIELYLS